MKRKLAQQNVVNNCDKLLKQQRDNRTRMGNLQREKEYKVTKICKEYEAQIEECLKYDESLALQIEMVKKYVETMDDRTAQENVTKKRA